MSGSSPDKGEPQKSEAESKPELPQEEPDGAEMDWEAARVAYESLTSTKRPRPVSIAGRKGGRFRQEGTLGLNAEPKRGKGGGFGDLLASRGAGTMPAFPFPFSPNIKMPPPRAVCFPRHSYSWASSPPTHLAYVFPLGPWWWWWWFLFL